MHPPLEEEQVMEIDCMDVGMPKLSRVTHAGPCRPGSRIGGQGVWTDAACARRWAGDNSATMSETQTSRVGLMQKIEMNPAIVFIHPPRGAHAPLVVTHR
ncbi:hypothetical protein BON30_18670 [Cystobacter ferrugineus]|uniref:Uncharacterized protein n=1 Tax=Cystobacter ferrugineus TaxID=83449 RepID=A0A1L9BBA8_9BACT|nr:hypothetical protein BON30_18670 [Cystobacter ferrugineus]